MASSKKKAGPPTKGRWSAKRKAGTVLRLLRGESLDEVSRETGVTAARLSEWRDEFLAAGEQGLKGRTDDPIVECLVEERRRLQAKIGELTMDQELLFEKIHRLEDQRPFLGWRSKK